MKLIFTLLFAGISSIGFSQQQKSVLLLHGYLHVGNGEVIESALIGIREGKIVEVKNSLASSFVRSEWDTIVDLMGKHIYPGFIAPNSTLGLTEIDAVRSTRDFEEVGTFNPHVRAQIAYNVESKVISTVRTNGVLITQATPRGNFISGTSAVMAMDGWNWEDATILGEDGVHVNWPASITNKRWGNDTGMKKNEQYEEQTRELSSFFEMSKNYSDKKPAEDARLEAMVNCFNGTKRVYFHANEMQQILDIIDFVKQHSIKFPVIIGGNDAYLLGQRMKDANIPIMVSRVHSLPSSDDDAIDLPYRIPALLQQLGIKFCLQNEGDMEAMNARNLPFLAGTAMAYGLTEEQAVQSVTLNAAQILGIDKEYGSIQEGKSATLFVSQGNALDMRTNKITHLMMNGNWVSTKNFQTELKEKYEEKYR
ncbi:MAG: amidohydrolase family protein [Bacteroidota bacterium]